MSKHSIQIRQSSEKPVAELFALLADHNQLSQVFGVPVTRIRDGNAEPNGVGSVRSLGIGPLKVEETVMAFEKDRSIDYRISRNGGPIRHHRGRISFEALDKGSQVTWEIHYEAPVAPLGAVIGKALETGLRLGLRRIA